MIVLVRNYYFTALTHDIMLQKAATLMDVAVFQRNLEENHLNHMPPLRHVDQFERLAMQALIPGLEFGATEAVKVLNRARAVIGLRPLAIQEIDEATVTWDADAPRRGRPRKLLEDGHAGAVQTDEEEAPKPKRGSYVRTAEGTKKVTDALRYRWQVCKEAGVAPTNGTPSRADVLRAEQILARRERKEQQKDEAIPAAAPVDQPPVEAVAQTAEPTAEPAAEPTIRRTLSPERKELLRQNNLYRWRVVREAGIKVASTSPSKAEIVEAERIIAARKKRALKKQTANASA